MALPGIVLEEIGSCDQQHACKLLAVALAEAAEKGRSDYQLACASILLQRAENESSCYDILLCASLARLRAPRKQPAAKNSSRLHSLRKQLESLCGSTLGCIPDFVTALLYSIENITDILSAAAILASAVLPPGRTSELMDDLFNRFWKEFVEHHCDLCRPSSLGSCDLEGWVRCLVVLCGVQTIGRHVGSLLGGQDGGQAYTERWLCVSGGDGSLGRMTRSLVSSTPSILHTCYQRWLDEDESSGQTEGVGELILMGLF